jgi:hypothetical protein
VSIEFKPWCITFNAGDVASHYPRRTVMSPINHAEIERRARALRAQEIQRYQGIIADRLGLYLRLLGESILAGLSMASTALRPLFSWNPQAHK